MRVAGTGEHVDPHLVPSPLKHRLSPSPKQHQDSPQLTSAKEKEQNV